MTELISVIVPTYNREDALDAVLRGLAAQTDRDFEIVVADDGSGPATACLVESWKPRIGRRVIHVRHEDRGFRLAEIRNRGILVSSGTLCVFLDGDCIPRRDFVAAHRRLAEPGWFVAGNRILMSRELTERILRDHVEPERWTVSDWLAARRQGSINRLVPLLHLPLGPLRYRVGRRWQGVRSANLAIRREDLARVDGFDAAFTGWGLEDSDIVIRLIRSGCRRKDGRFATGVLHLWHPVRDRSGLVTNERKLEESMRGDRVKAVKGLSRLE